MRKNIYGILFGLIACLIGTSCADNDMELNKGNDVLSLTVNKETATLDIRQPSAEAITFNWTSGTNEVTGAAISYVLQMDVQGKNFASGIYEDLGKKIYSRTYTVNELNRILIEEFALNPGQEVTLEARIVANVSDDRVAEQTSPVVLYKVIPFKPISSTLYLIGDATPNGWSTDNATKMNSISGEAGSFIWSGSLNAGKLKFITTLGQFLPSYNKNADQMALIYRETDDQPDEQFTVEKNGKYQVKINILDLTISIEPLAGPKYQNIYFVGSFTGWGFEPMIQDPINPFVFRYGAVLNWTDGGEFKFGTQSGSWDNMYHPTMANAPYTHTAVTQSADGDNKWLLTQSQCGKAYKMSLDITEGTEVFTMNEFTPYAGLYLVGDATPSGWDINNATTMKSVTGDPYTFTWTGTLNAGEMKISCDKKGDWMGAWFMPAINGTAPTGQSEIITFVDKSIATNGDIDRKWNIANAGSYTIELNQLKETIIIKKN